MAQYEINPCKKYSIPQNISIICHKGFYIAIAPDLACWIVMQSQEQVDILEAFKDGCSIQEVLSNQTYNKQDVGYVVTQIEARRFYDKKVHSVNEFGRNLHLYLTNQCNLSCPHCYMFSGKANEDEMTTTEVIKLLSDYKNIASGSNVTISGGEPTMREDFDVIVKAAAELGLKVQILSNGVFLTKERIARLSKYIDSVQISIDGFSEDTNAKIRGVGHFEKALLSIKNLLLFDIETSVAITPPYDILKDNVDNYILFARELMRQYEGKPLEIKFAGELLSGRLINPSRSRKSDYLALVEQVQKEFYGPDYDISLFVQQFSRDNILDNCMFGVFSVASNGDVFCCARIGDLLPIANVRRDSFEDICKKSYEAELATSVSMLQPCKDCELRCICGGGCRIDEFPELIRRTSYTNLDYEIIPPRNCTSVIKFHFYDLMIRSNKYLYKPLPVH